MRLYEQAIESSAAGGGDHYDLHIGTFTPEGSLQAAIEKIACSRTSATALCPHVC
jgi:hypothetical protein